MLAAALAKHRDRQLDMARAIIPIVDGGRVTAIVTREDFSRALAQRLLAAPS